MFSLVSGFVTWYFSKTEVKILVLGLDNAGKTTFLERTKSMYSANKSASVPLDRITPTIGLNMGRLQAHGCDVTLWDLGGQQSFRSIWDKYFDDADILIYVVDAADETRFTEAAKTLTTVLEHTEKLPVLVVANKSDMPLSHDVDSLRTLFHMEEVTSRRTANLLAASALTSAGVADALQWVIETVKMEKGEII